jgi:competence protein ComEC
MTNWRIQSVVGDQWYAFPNGYVLAAGGHVRVHSGPDAVDSPPPDLKWTGAYIWNKNSDEARLYDSQGGLVHSWSY